MSPAEGRTESLPAGEPTQAQEQRWYQNRRLQVGGALAAGVVALGVITEPDIDLGGDNRAVGAGDPQEVTCDVDNVRELTKTYPEDSFFPRRDIDDQEEAEATRVSWFKEQPLSGETDPASMAALVSALTPFKDKETVKPSDYTRTFEKKLNNYEDGDGESAMQRDCEALEKDTRVLFDFNEDGDWTSGQNIVQLVPVYRGGEVVGSRLQKVTSFEDLKGIEFKINESAESAGYNGGPEVLLSENGGIYLKGVEPTPRNAKRPQDHKAKGGRDRDNRGRSNRNDARGPRGRGRQGAAGGGGSTTNGPSPERNQGPLSGPNQGPSTGPNRGPNHGARPGPQRTPSGGGGGGGVVTPRPVGGGGGGGPTPPSGGGGFTPPPSGGGGFTPPPSGGGGETPPPKGPDPGCPPGAPCE